MGVEALVTELEREGASLAVVGEEIKLRAPANRVPPPEIIARLREHRADLLAYLRARAERLEFSSAVPQDYRDCKTAELKAWPEAVPTGAVLVAPRYDGVGKPLAAVPECWCCATPYRLERLQQWKGKTFAWLEPGCGCLDAQICYACFVCRDHCRCQAK